MTARAIAMDRTQTMPLATAAPGASVPRVPDSDPRGTASEERNLSADPSVDLSGSGAVTGDGKGPGRSGAGPGGHSAPDGAAEDSLPQIGDRSKAEPAIGADAPEERVRVLERGLRRATERVRYRAELLVALAGEERRLRDEVAVLEDTLRSLDRGPADYLGVEREELGRVAVQSYIEKRKEMARLRAHLQQIGEELDRLEPELARRQAEYASFRRDAETRRIRRSQDRGPGRPLGPLSLSRT